MGSTQGAKDAPRAHSERKQYGDSQLRGVEQASRGRETFGTLGRAQFAHAVLVSCNSVDVFPRQRT